MAEQCVGAVQVGEQGLGQVVRGRDLFGGRSVQDIVAGYEDAGAPCLSVVTGRWFGGTLALLHEVAQPPKSPCCKRTSSPGGVSCGRPGRTVLLVPATRGLAVGVPDRALLEGGYMSCTDPARRLLRASGHTVLPDGS
ncbi:hypothetical protein [Streptomyces tubercidicus]|uniref:hypothetical protein n=1 Tax=Streptomyces tubercidicus TaxID=47759 RepID=UPI0036CB0034